MGIFIFKPMRLHENHAELIYPALTTSPIASSKPSEEFLLLKNSTSCNYFYQVVHPGIQREVFQLSKKNTDVLFF